MLKWVGRLSVGLAILAFPGTLFDPVLVTMAWLALILGGVSAIAGTVRYALICGLIVSATVVAAANTFSPGAASNATIEHVWFKAVAIPYGFAAALALLGVWRKRRWSHATVERPEN